MITFNVYGTRCFQVLLMGIGLITLWVSCATKAPPSAVIPPVPARQEPVVPEANPTAFLTFERIEAQNIDHITLHFLLKIENPRSSVAHITLGDWQCRVNGLALAAQVTLVMDRDDTGMAAFSSTTLPLRLEWELPEGHETGIPPSTDADADVYQVYLRVNPVFVFETGDTTGIWAEAAGEFPRIRAPELILTAIAVSKAELINTRLKVSLRIDNPNIFPVVLSSFTYKLYGSGRFWADGEQRDVLSVPAKGSAETQVNLIMNFIDMNRQLLDQVIALKQVRYRFSGEANVGTTIAYLPQFRMRFDQSGNSTVVE